MSYRKTTTFPDETLQAWEYIRWQLEKAPWKEFAEQDTIYALLANQGYFIIQDLKDKNRIDNVCELDQQPHNREALYLGSIKSYIDETENLFETYAVYLHKKTGNYYKFKTT